MATLVYSGYENGYGQNITGAFEYFPFVFQRILSFRSLI